MLTPPSLCARLSCDLSAGLSPRVQLQKLNPKTAAVLEETDSLAYEAQGQGLGTIDTTEGVYYFVGGLALCARVGAARSHTSGCGIPPPLESLCVAVSLYVSASMSLSLSLSLSVCLCLCYASLCPPVRLCVHAWASPCVSLCGMRDHLTGPWMHAYFSVCVCVCILLSGVSAGTNVSSQTISLVGISGASGRITTEIELPLELEMLVGECAPWRWALAAHLSAPCRSQSSGPRPLDGMCAHAFFFPFLFVPFRQCRGGPVLRL